MKADLQIMTKYVEIDNGKPFTKRSFAEKAIRARINAKIFNYVTAVQPTEIRYYGFLGKECNEGIHFDLNCIKRGEYRYIYRIRPEGVGWTITDLTAEIYGEGE